MRSQSPRTVLCNLNRRNSRSNGRSRHRRNHSPIGNVSPNSTVPDHERTKGRRQTNDNGTTRPTRKCTPKLVSISKVASRRSNSNRAPRRRRKSVIHQPNYRTGDDGSNGHRSPKGGERTPFVARNSRNVVGKRNRRRRGPRRHHPTRNVR